MNYIFSKLLNLFLIFNEKGNSIYLRGQSPQETEKKRFFLIFFLTERNIGDIRTLGYVLVIF